MKSMLIIASFIAVAVASPTYRGLVAPGAAGPAPAPENIAVGPAILDFTPIAVGPTPVDSFEPVAVGPTPVFVEEAQNADTPIVQIILNINGVSHVIDTPIAAPTPVEVPVAVPAPAPVPVEIPVAVPAPAPEPVQVVEVAPAEIGAPVLPVISPEPVVIGTPMLPNPAVVLPENLN